MTELKTAKVIEVAASTELELARKRIRELEAVAKSRGAIGQYVIRGIGWMLLAMVMMLSVELTLAAMRRLAMWGWP